VVVHCNPVKDLTVPEENVPGRRDMGLARDGVSSKMQDGAIKGQIEDLVLSVDVGDGQLV